MIKIKKSREGLFTDKARRAGMSVPAFARRVLAEGSRYSAETKRQANFARNSRKWSHK